ncbi:hypothetical protein [Micromonospora sp. NPDC048063]|uniref:hypothetical protein n=1 Tax=Micromonospora sp. NPDC048063 TaxID=3364256 RepID=UPI003711CC66
MSAYDSWRFEVSSADPDAAIPVWVNLTSRVRTTGTGARPLQIRRGAGSERDDIQPSTLTAQLENTDHWLTPDNPMSPYAGWWGQGRKCRVVETANGVDYIRFTGFLKPLDLPDWAEPGVEQIVTVSAVDWLGRLDRAPAFAGTLGEHVRTAGGPLVEHFPLDDSYPHMSSKTLATLTRYVYGFQESVAQEPEDLIRATSLAGPPGDDQSYPQWDPVGHVTGFLAQARLRSPINVPVGASDVVAVSAWLYRQPDEVNDYSGPILTVGDAQSLSGGLIINDLRTGNSVAGTVYSGASDVDVLVGRRLESDVWRLVTVRYDMTSGAVDVWLGSDAAASGFMAPPAPFTLTEAWVGLEWVGSIAHVQVRVGPPATTMTRAMHLAQYAHGYRGLHRQTVAERITTLAGYAGVPAADLSIDAGASTPMQRARLARQKPASAMRSAASAEGGARLFTRGSGEIRLRPRQARYRQAVTLQIPYAWLQRGLRFREDTPINDVVASQAGGGQTRRTDAASVQRYGSGGDPVTLDTAIDADPGNYASWTVQAYKSPRLRCPQLHLDLLPRTPAERAQLLALDIGDRIEITGGPATIPTAARHLIIEGLAPDEIGVASRSITFTTSPLLGPSAGTPPTGVIVGDLVSPTAVVAY